MAQWRIHYMLKEVHLLSGPSELQLVADYTIPTHCTHKEFCFLPEPSKNKMDPNSFTKQTLVQHRQNTSWEPATVVSQSSSNSHWIMQENGTDQPRVYRRTRSMLKIRCTNIRQTRHNCSQLTGTEKAKFQNPFTYNDERNFVECNSVKKISDDPPNKIRYFLCFCFYIFRRKGGNCRRCSCSCRHSCTYTCTCTHTGDSQGTALHSRIKKVNEEEPWKASQYI